MSTRAFLDQLFRDCDVGVVEVRALPSTRRMWIPPGQWNDLGAFLTAAVNGRENVYVGVATRRDASSGTAANLLYLPAVWVDFDLALGEVTRRLARFPFPPSIVVHSGLGVHAYWLLRELFPVQDAADLARAGSILRRLAGHLGGDDRACDPARVLRVPGTFNYKYDDPRTVTLASTADVVVDLSELDDHLPHEVIRQNQFVLEATITPGARNDVLYNLTRSLRAKGLPVSVITRTVEDINHTQCDPPLPGDELFGLIKRAIVQADRPTFEPTTPITIIHDAVPPVAAPADGGIVVNLATVAPEAVDWLWPGWLPRRKGVVLAGDPGTGKSLVSLDLAARLSRGVPWPTGEGAPRSRVLLLVAEDGLADTVRPRVEAAGGDVSQVDVLTAVREPAGDRLVNLARDVAILDATLQRTQPALLIVDPLNAYLGDTDAYKDAAVRGLLTPLLDLADRHRCVLLWIAHLTKTSDRRALYRPGASIAFVAAARVVIVAGAHPDDPARSALAQAKNNLAPLAEGLAYGVETGRVTWQGAVACTADGVLQDAASPVTGPVHTFLADLRDRAADGRIDVEEAFVRAELMGIPRRTLQHAAGRAGLVSCCTGKGSTRQTFWIDPLKVRAS